MTTSLSKLIPVETRVRSSADRLTQKIKMEKKLKLTAAGRRITVDQLVDRLDSLHTKFEILDCGMFMSEEVRMKIVTGRQRTRNG